MRVVLSGYYGFHNVGDEAILLSIITALRKFDEKIEITVLSNDPIFTKKEYGVNAVNRWSIKEVREAIKHSDGLISGGGSLLQDITGNRSVVYYTGVMFIAKMVKKPYFIYAQGIGPVDKRMNQWLTKLACNNASLVSVRDQDSKNLLEKIGVKRKVELVPDPVLGLTDEKIDSYQATKDDPKITVSVREWETQNDYLEKIAKGLDKLVKKGMSIVLLPMHGENDDKTSKDLQKLMNEKVEITPFDASIEEKVNIIGNSSVLIGMRLHALIFAATRDVPFIALSYDPKIDAFANLCSQTVVGHVVENTWNENDIVTVVEDYLTNKNEKLLEMQNYTNQAKIDAQNTAKIVLSMLKAKGG